MRLRNLRRLEEMEIRTEDKDLRAEHEKRSRSCCAPRPQQWKTIARADPRGARHVRAEDAARQAPHRLSPRRRQHDEAAIEEAMVEREPITVVVSREGLDPGAARPGRRSFRPCLQGRRRPRARVLRRDHVETADASPPTAASTPSRRRSCRAGAAMASRSGCSSTSSRRPIVIAVFRYRGRPQVPGREPGRAGASSSPRTSASAIPARASRCSTSRCRTRPRDRAGRRRTGRGDRRQPQDAGVPARPGAGNGARPRRAAAALQATAALSDVKTFEAEDGLDLDRFRRPRVHAIAEGAGRLARQPRRRRPPRAEGLSEDQQVRRAMIGPTGGGRRPMPARQACLRCGLRASMR